MALEQVKEFLLGALVMGDVTLTLFFVRYWKVTGDRFFLFFAWSFALGALSRLLLAGHMVDSESEPLVYLVRLTSYFIILAGVVDKNRSLLTKLLFQRT